jgi:hypothetical protein
MKAMDRVMEFAEHSEREAQRRREERERRDPERGWLRGRALTAAELRPPRHPGWLVAWRRWRPAARSAAGHRA